MKIFISLDPEGGVLAVSTNETTDHPVQAEFTGAFYPEKLSGYKLEADNDGLNHLVFDEQLYQEIKAKEAETKALEEAEKLMDDLTRLSAMKSATDSQALTMMPLYPVWTAGTHYVKGERVRFGNGGFAKVLSAHDATVEPDQDETHYKVLVESEKNIELVDTNKGE